MDIIDLIKQHIQTHKSKYQQPQDIYGAISCIMHEMAHNSVNQHDIDANLIDIICECCLALCQLYPKKYDRILNNQSKQTKAELDLLLAKDLIQDILQVYKDTPIEKIQQLGQPPKRLIYLPPELVTTLFSLFN